MFKENKKIFITVLVVLLAFIIYAFFFKKPPEVGVLQTDGSLTSSQIPGRDLIIILRRLESINLDGSVFESAAFKSLTDFSLPLVKEPIGRDNPFAPVGIEGVEAASTSAKTTAIESTAAPVVDPVVDLGPGPAAEPSGGFGI